MGARGGERRGACVSRVARRCCQGAAPRPPRARVRVLGGGASAVHSSGAHAAHDRLGAPYDLPGQGRRRGARGPHAYARAVRRTHGTRGGGAGWGGAADPPRVPATTRPRPLARSRCVGGPPCGPCRAALRAQHTRPAAGDHNAGIPWAATAPPARAPQLPRRVRRRGGAGVTVGGNVPRHLDPPELRARPPVASARGRLAPLAPARPALGRASAPGTLLRGRRGRGTYQRGRACRRSTAVPPRGNCARPVRRVRCVRVGSARPAGG
mmetsp:Transcript_43593/g.139057  ORF Transcript_43593/g.139057 Transcript_43593/m.139057 type:complete len:267 (+) Transcript_43593:965-1765(+)